MTDTRKFDSLGEANAFLDSLGEYENPPKVSPLKGHAAHEVAVGPVHAGVIEPGHFRFQCMGEDVYNLQIFLGYQHRGVEEEMVRSAGFPSRQIALAETCAGDTSVAAAIAYSEIIEAKEGLAPKKEHLRLRRLLLELERIANHAGDLGALAGDVAYLPSSSFLGRIRGEYLNMTALLCGNRFGRNAVVPGGMRIKLTDEKKKSLKEWIRKVKPDLDDAARLVFETPSVTERFEGTGKVSKEAAERLGLVGVARRASLELEGDVLSRARMRQTEIESSHKAIDAILDGKDAMEAATGETRKTDGGAPFSAIVSTVDAWRGPLVHAAIFGEAGRMLRYKITDPSVRNWHGLAWALRGEQISNFPICNKSFNLSYCGTDR